MIDDCTGTNQHTHSLILAIEDQHVQEGLGVLNSQLRVCNPTSAEERKNLLCGGVLWWRGNREELLNGRGRVSALLFGHAL